MTSTDKSRIKVGGFDVDVVRKDIKNLHLGVYPPSGRVRVAVPLATSDEAIRLAVVGKVAWIRRQKAKLAEQPRQSEREAVTGESHYFLGQRFRLSIEPAEGYQFVNIRTKTRMELHVREGATTEQKMKVLDQWYRTQLREILLPLVNHWQETIGVTASFVGVRRMKTKWGSCNPTSGRIWLNSELAKKDPACIEYIVVHELIHLLEPQHGDRFIELMERFLPDWRARRDHLNRSPLAHESWSY